MNAVTLPLDADRVAVPVPAPKEQAWPVRAAPAAPDADLKAWLGVFGATLGAFMAVLNIQIVNASLANIQGAIGAGIDDGGWISTSYLIAEIIVIPLSAWLSRVFSVRKYLLFSSAMFLVFSAACGLAHNLPQMIVLRAFQGFFGGALIPLAFTLIITLLPKSKQPVGLAMFAISATFAPAIGPTIGGWLTDNYGWEYIFYVNILPGAVMIAMLWYALERTPANLKLLRQGDWFGILTMAVGLGALQTVLEQGNRDDWFGSAFIMRLSAIAVLSLIAFVVVELAVERPLLNLRLFFRRNFGLTMIATFMLGFVLYGSIFILPVYLSTMQGYNAEQIGEVLAWTGLPQLLIIPFLPALMKKFDVRLLAGLGFALFALSNFMNVHLDADVAGVQLLWPNVVRAVGQSLVLTPLSAIAASGMEPENTGSASSIFNVMRNLGGAVGIAMLQTMLTRREQYHSAVLMSNVNLGNGSTYDHIQALSRRFMASGVTDPAEAWHEAVMTVGRLVREQAYFLAYGDVFMLLGIAMLLALAAVVFLRKTHGLNAPAGH